MLVEGSHKNFQKGLYMGFGIGFHVRHIEKGISHRF